MTSHHPLCHFESWFPVRSQNEIGNLYGYIQEGPSRGCRIGVSVKIPTISHWNALCHVVQEFTSSLTPNYECGIPITIEVYTGSIIAVVFNKE